MACVYIPVQNSEEEVRVSLDQLPRDATDILDILKAEQAPLDLWLVIAREYFKQGKIEQFCQILEEGSSPEINEYYADVRYERIAILNALGAYYSYIGKIETGLKEKDNHFAKATQYYNRASRIDMHESSTWVGKGQLLLAKGDVEQAFNTFKIVLDGDPDNVPALLGQASVQFNRGRYSESLELYKRALRVYPDCPGAVRLGIGLCRYKLGHFERARQAFERVLQLDPENVEALVALGVMDLHANDAAGIRKGMEKMLLAFEIYPYNALSLNYLANHFFFTGQHFLVEQLTETALAVTNHGPTKAHSYYNLARSYHSKGDYEKAGRYYMASVKESSKPQEFVLPYYGLGQVQLKLGDYRSSLANFEKVLEVYPENCETLKSLGHIYAILHQTDKALEVLRKVTRIDPRDAQAFLDLGEILITSDTGAALEAYRNARVLLRKVGEDVPIDLLNNIGVLHFERGEFELAEQTFKDALGSGVWLSLINGKENNYVVDAFTALVQYKDVQIFHRLEEEGSSVELPWSKVSTIFNLARLLEESHKTLSAILLYRLILYKYPEYVDALLRLAAIAKARSNIQLSIELVGEALKVNDKCPGALAILGCLELKNDEWVKAKETFRAASEAADGKDFYASVCLGNWNYFAALVSELKKQVKHIPVHLEKAKDMYSNVLKKCTSNLYAANGLGMILAEKGQFDVSKEIFTQVQEAGSGTIFSQMPDVWINLAHVYFAQGNYTLAVKMYQNCLRKFYFNTESQLFLYLARTHYEAEQWQESKRTLLRAIRLSPSNYTLRFNLGVVMQKFSASLLNKEKRSADEMRTTVSELEIAISVFGQLAVAFNQNIHGIDEKKIETHVSYCKHLLEVAKVYREAAELEEQQSRQRLELARQVTLAEEARRKAEEQQRLQMEKRKQEEELKRVKEMEQRFERVKEQLKSSSQPSKRKERAQSEDEEGEHSEKKRRKGGKKKRRDKSEKSHYETEEVEADRMEFQEDMDEHHNDYEEPTNQLDTVYDDEEDMAQDPLAAVGLEDSDVEDDMGAPTTASRRRQAWAESDEDEPVYRHEDSSPLGENTRQHETGTVRDDENETNVEADDDID
ncbi:protein CTR9 homolog [Chenopodium quinoa]|nr:protein CTR9 homolog [Chenopodium quinoa]